MRARSIVNRFPWILAAVCLALGLLGVAHGATVGYWRFDDPGAADGGLIGTALTEVNSATLNGTGASGVVYTDSVPGRFIYDPVSGLTHANEFALDGSGSNDCVNVPNNALLDTSDFTVEMFFRIIGQPHSYDSFAKRNQGGDPRWQIDFSHGGNAGDFGQIRARMDNAGQENVVPTGAYVFVDTDSGSGNPADYTDATGDVADEGDGINDDLSWHHVAITYDASDRRFTIFTDYEQGSFRTLDDLFVQPDAALQIGKLVNSNYGLMIDEFRYSDGVLSVGQFLQVVPEPSTLVLLALGSLALFGLRRRRARQ